MADDRTRQLLRDGYVVVPEFLSAAATDELRRACDELLREIAAGRGFAGVEVTRGEGSEAPIVQVWNAEAAAPAIDRAAADDALLDLVEPLLGPDIALFEAKLLPKPAGTGAAVPLHQDFAYWRDRCPEAFHLCAMLLLDDADANNGALEIAPASHRRGLLGHRRHIDRNGFAERVDDDAGPEDYRVVEARAGSVILFTSLTAHRSRPNRSERARRALTFVYTPSSNGPTRRRLRHPAAADLPLPADLPRVTGAGPHGGQCAAHYRNRELAKMALAAAAKGRAAYVGDGANGRFEWLAARSPADAPPLRFGTEGEGARTWESDESEELPRRDGAEGAPLGLLFLETRFAQPARAWLQRLAGTLADGAIVVAENAFATGGEAHPVVAAALDVEGLEPWARADHALALRWRGDASSASPAAIEWTPESSSLSLRPSTEAVATPAAHKPLPFLRQRLREARWRRASPFGDLFPWLSIPRVVGRGSPQATCPIHERRRELWRIAIEAVADPDLPWVELGVGEGESFEWWASRKPPENRLFGFDGFTGIPEPWLGHPAGHWRAAPFKPQRDDLEIVVGDFRDTLKQPDVKARIGGQIGFLHVDCDLYASTVTALGALRDAIGPGTVLVFDEYYAYPGWEQHEAKAWLEWCVGRGVRFEYLARADGPVALRVLAVDVPAEASVAAPPAVAGLGLTWECEEPLSQWVLTRIRSRLH